MRSRLCTLPEFASACTALVSVDAIAGAQHVLTLFASGELRAEEVRPIARACVRAARSAHNACPARADRRFGARVATDSPALSLSRARAHAPAAPQALVARYEACIDASAPIDLPRLLAPAPLQLVPLLVKPHVIARGHLHRVWRALSRAGFEVAAVRLLRLRSDGSEVVVHDGLEVDDKGGASAPAASLSAVLAGGACGGGACGVEPLEPAVEGTAAVFAVRRPAALRLIRSLAGAPSPARAKREGAFTMRAMFGIDDEHNAVQLPAHAAAVAAAIELAFPLERGHAPCPPMRPGAPRADDPLMPAGVMSAPLRKLVRSSAASLCELLLVAVPCALVRADPEIVSAGLLDKALAERFEVCAVRIAQLSDAQAARLLSRARAPALAARALSAGPCVLLALQRDNALARFAALQRTALRQLAPPHAYASASAPAAAADLADAFDELHGARGFALVRV